ncbi:indole-3-glycerol phosphate synthase TrpC [Phragmitibacter flavus]|uniref:Indole-3-glycerol phosphate synthase n=1 Tax=Phragmitibacter flavus TaxID=2576071 RepID=A0A5R8KJ17_9BACT|nr:indole-3-glycerol phosphate synthase TrpC [Phragmitibacter flavus]TLD71935.1 indole-3-glycerol phosphate synthase TrpC [Phragmitibacter flavus]
MNKLEEIIAYKHTEVQRLLPRMEKLRAAAALRNDHRSLYDALRADETRLGLIAEVKKASPSAGVIQADFDYLTIARSYEKGGATALSVLTDEKYFQGRLDYMTTIRREVSIPVLRKDFMVHEAQIYEAVVAGADAILLIVAALDQATLVHLMDVAYTFQMDVLVEVHNLEELERALDTDVRILGINNRNLKAFTVDLATTEELAEEVPEDVVLVSESGIKSVADAVRLAACGADALLVGETLMRHEHPIEMARALRVEKQLMLE